MITGIYPYIMGMSTPGPKKIENSFRNLPDGRVDNTADARSGGEKVSLNPLASVEGVEMNMSGFVTSASLFTNVSDANASQGLPQMILYQRGYKTNPKAVGKDGSSEHTLDIVI